MEEPEEVPIDNEVSNQDLMVAEVMEGVTSRFLVLVVKEKVV